MKRIKRPHNHIHSALAMANFRVPPVFPIEQQERTLTPEDKAEIAFLNSLLGN